MDYLYNYSKRWLLFTGAICFITILYAQSTGNVKQTKNSDEGVTIGGITWATRNVGAPGTFVEKYWETGMYYQWNKRVGWSRECDEEGYPYYSIPDGIKWDDYHNWDSDINPCPDGWRIPSMNEYEILLSAMDSARSVEAGEMFHKKAGMYFYSKNRNIFLPYGGMRDAASDGKLYSEYNGSPLHYWSSTTNSKHTANAWCLTTSNGHFGFLDNFKKKGFLIRCVKSR